MRSPGAIQPSAHGPASGAVLLSAPSALGLARVDPDTFASRTSFAGRLQVHGLLHIVLGQAQVHHDGQFEAMTLADLGGAPPLFRDVGVKGTAAVKLALLAAPATSAGGTQ